MAKNAATQQVQADLDAAIERGVIAAAKSDNPTGNKLVWTVTLSEAAQAMVGDYDTTVMETKEVRAFLAGALAGSTGTKVKAPRALKPNKYRDAIAKDGRVEFKVSDPKDQGEMKKARNMLFSLAYTLGYKGEFKVTTKDDGLLVGEVNPEVFKAKQS